MTRGNARGPHVPIFEGEAALGTVGSTWGCDNHTLLIPVVRLSVALSAFSFLMFAVLSCLLPSSMSSVRASRFWLSIILTNSSYSSSKTSGTSVQTPGTKRWTTRRMQSGARLPRRVASQVFSRARGWGAPTVRRRGNWMKAHEDGSRSLQVSRLRLLQQWHRRTRTRCE